MIKNGKCVNVKDVKNIATDDDEYIPFPTMRVLLHPIKVTEPRYHQGALEVSSQRNGSRPVAELKLSPTQRQRSDAQGVERPS